MRTKLVEKGYTIHLIAEQTGTVNERPGDKPVDQGTSCASKHKSYHHSHGNTVMDNDDGDSFTKGNSCKSGLL